MSAMPRYCADRLSGIQSCVSDDDVLRTLRRRVAVVMDFDETLAPRSNDVILEHLGVDPEEFQRTVVRPRVDDGWEPGFANLQGLLDISHSDRGPVTREMFAEVGRNLELYPGVPELFRRLRDAVDGIADCEVEFHLLTAGMTEIPEATPIADEFTSMLGGGWAFDDEGRIHAIKRMVGHYDKVRHLKALAKGLDSIRATAERDIDRGIPEAEWYVPYEQMVFVGDGDSDLPAFDFMQDRAGTAIAVHQSRDGQQWESRGEMRRGREVAALVESDFSEGSPGLAVLTAAVRRAAYWVATVAATPGRS